MTRLLKLSGSTVNIKTSPWPSHTVQTTHDEVIEDELT